MDYATAVQFDILTASIEKARAELISDPAVPNENKVFALGNVAALAMAAYVLTGHTAEEAMTLVGMELGMQA